MVQVSACIWLSEVFFVRGKLREQAMALLIVRDNSIKHSLKMLEHFLKLDKYKWTRLELGAMKSAEVAAQILAKLCRLQTSASSQLKPTALSGLQTLYLNFTHVNTAVMKQLQQLHLPAMKHMGISFRQSSPSADMSGLQAMNFQWMASLNLSLTGMGDADVEQLVLASLPQLKSLDLSSNKLNMAAIQHLVAGQWELLADLDLGCNHQLDGDSVECLVQGSWPCLQSLQLDVKCFTSKTSP